MIYENIKGIYRPVNTVISGGGVNHQVNKKYEIVNGSYKKVYNPWILVKNGKLVNKFHLVFINEYNQTLVDLKDYTKVYENDDGVWVELIRPYSYYGYLPRTSASTRFLLSFSVAGCHDKFEETNYKMVSTYRSINYQCTYADTLWGMFPFSAGGGREDYHLNTKAVNGAWTTLAGDVWNEVGTVNGKKYATIVGLQAVNGGNRTVTYNSMKLCIKDFYSYTGELKL